MLFMVFQQLGDELELCSDLIGAARLSGALNATIQRYQLACTVSIV